MKYLLTTLLCVTALIANAAAQTTTPTIVTPTDVRWTAGTGPMMGSQVAVITGDPTKAGPYVMRIKLSDGAKFAPHYHGDTENVTVLEGTLMVGLGDTIDASKMTALPAGSFVMIPQGVHHYAMAKGDTVIQINAMGPASINMVGKP